MSWTRAVCSDNRLLRPISLPCGSRHPRTRWTDGTRRDEGADEGYLIGSKKQNKTRSGIVVNNTLAKAPCIFFLIFWQENFTAESVKVSSHLKELYGVHRNHQVQQLDSLCTVQMAKITSVLTAIPTFMFMSGNLEVVQLQQQTAWLQCCASQYRKLAFATKCWIEPHDSLNGAV